MYFIETIDIPSFKRSKVIGSGGHKIRLLIEETGMAVTNIIIITVKPVYNGHPSDQQK